MKNILVIFIFILSFFGATAQVSTECLIGYWPFDGNVADSSGHNNDGVLHGPYLTYDRFKVEDKAYLFERAVDDYIETNIHDEQLIEYTAAAWFYWYGEHNSHAMGTFLYANQGWCWKAYENKVRMLHNNTVIYSTKEIIPNTWFHVAVSFDGDIAKIYFNGKLNASDTASVTTGETFMIGAIPKYTSVYNWDGMIDEVLLYDRAIEPDEVMEIYKEGKWVEL